MELPYRRKKKQNAIAYAEDILRDCQMLILIVIGNKEAFRTGLCR